MHYGCGRRLTEMSMRKSEVTLPTAIKRTRYSTPVAGLSRCFNFQSQWLLTRQCHHSSSACVSMGGESDVFSVLSITPHRRECRRQELNLNHSLSRRIIEFNSAHTRLSLEHRCGFRGMIFSRDNRNPFGSNTSLWRESDARLADHNRPFCH